MVLAHNEEHTIVPCLDSIYESEPGRKFDIFVMANGCTDETESIVLEYAKSHEGVNLVSIAMPDKCNAWNVFIHDTVPRLVPDRDIYFFMDGDCRVCPSAISEMMRGLDESPVANAAGARPMAGHDMEKDAAMMKEERTLVANLYALRGRFVRELEKHGVRLPVGLEGDDGLIGSLVKWDLDPTREWNHDRLVHCARAGFVFDPVSWTKPSEWTPYLRRLVRYGRRRYEFELLGPILKEKGLLGLPTHISGIYAHAGELKLRWQGVYTITNYIALKQLQKHAR
jgi:glycosyltransferase involved in cell wall biosynthesis